MLFSILILRLGFVQIVYGENFKRELERKEDITINNPVPRGKMFDSNHRVIVNNIPMRAITYTNMGASQKEMLETAEKLAQLIVKKTDKVTERDKKDFWLIKNPEKANAKITEKENALFKAKKLKDDDLYKLKLDRITTEEIEQFTPEELEVLAIYRDLSSGYKFTPQIVKNDDVTPEEFAIVSENLQSLPGVDTTTDWDRSYTFDTTLKSILGNVTKTEEGLPADRFDHFLSWDITEMTEWEKASLNFNMRTSFMATKQRLKPLQINKGMSSKQKWYLMEKGARTSSLRLIWIYK